MRVVKENRNGAMWWRGLIWSSTARPASVMGRFNARESITVLPRRPSLQYFSFSLLFSFSPVSLMLRHSWKASNPSPSEVPFLLFALFLRKSLSNGSSSCLLLNGNASSGSSDAFSFSSYTPPFPLAMKRIPSSNFPHRFYARQERRLRTFRRVTTRCELLARTTGLASCTLYSSSFFFSTRSRHRSKEPSATGKEKELSSSIGEPKEELAHLFPTPPGDTGNTEGKEKDGWQQAGKAERDHSGSSRHEGGKAAQLSSPSSSSKEWVENPKEFRWDSSQKSFSFSPSSSNTATQPGGGGDRSKGNEGSESHGGPRKKMPFAARKEKVLSTPAAEKERKLRYGKPRKSIDRAKWTQRGMVLAAVFGATGLVYYFTTYTCTLTTDPSPYKNTMFHHFPCDYAIKENRWTGYRQVITLEEEECLAREELEKRVHRRWEESEKERPPAALEAASSFSPLLSFSPSISNDGAPVHAERLTNALPPGPAASVARSHLVVTKKISVHRLKDRMYCYLQKKNSCMIIPLEEEWRAGVPANDGEEYRLHSNGKGIPFATAEKKMRSTRQSGDEDSSAFVLSSMRTEAPALSDALPPGQRSALSEKDNAWTPFHVPSVPPAGERAMTSGTTAPSFLPQSLVVESVVRPLTSKNGYQKGQLPRYEQTIGTVTRELLRKKYEEYLFHRVGVDREIGGTSACHSLEKAPSSPSVSHSSGARVTHRVLVEELVRQNMEVLKKKEKVQLKALIPDMIEFTDEVRKEIQKRLGMEVIIYEFSIRPQPHSPVYL